MYNTHAHHQFASNLLTYGAMWMQSMRIQFDLLWMPIESASKQASCEHGLYLCNLELLLVQNVPLHLTSTGLSVVQKFVIHNSFLWKKACGLFAQIKSYQSVYLCYIVRQLMDSRMEFHFHGQPGKTIILFDFILFDGFIGNHMMSWFVWCACMYMPIVRLW